MLLDADGAAFRRLMNLMCIAAIAVAILVEKTLPRGISTSRLIGTVLIAGGAVTLVSPDFWRLLLQLI